MQKTCKGHFYPQIFQASNSGNRNCYQNKYRLTPGYIIISLSKMEQTRRPSLGVGSMPAVSKETIKSYYVSQSLAGRVIALQTADLESILGTPHGHLNPARSKPQHSWVKPPNPKQNKKYLQRAGSTDSKLLSQ